MGDAKIFLLGDGEQSLTPMTATPYATEDILQALLAQYPDLLPGDQIDPESPRRWLLVSREVAVPGDSGEVGRWSLDHLFLDQDATPTFVECKRASDTRGRREVVAQMLDYAANGIEYWSMDRLRQAAAETATRRGKSLDAEIRQLLGREDAEVEPFWQQVEANLRAGRVRLIFVTEETPRELRRLVEFLNDKMADIEVLAVEVRQFVGQGRKALVPRVVGLTEAGRSVKRGEGVRKSHITPEEFLAACPPAAAPLFRRVLALAEERKHTVSWTKVGFSVQAAFPVGPVTFLEGYPTPKLYFKFGDLRLAKPAEQDLCGDLATLGAFEKPTEKYLRFRLGADLPPALMACDTIFKKIDALIAATGSATTAASGET